MKTKTIEKILKDLKKRYNLKNDDISIHITMSIDFKLSSISFHFIDIDNNVFRNKNRKFIKDSYGNDMIYFSENDIYNDIDILFFSKTFKNTEGE